MGGCTLENAWMLQKIDGCQFNCRFGLSLCSMLAGTPDRAADLILRSKLFACTIFTYRYIHDLISRLQRENVSNVAGPGTMSV